ncbi:peptidoglycan-associated lipoprotein Pal [bacterium]|nr:peptidoglycan-associated lipoprotein Pal [bacterium]
MQDPIVEPDVIEETSADTGDDIPLPDPNEDIVYIEPGAHVFVDIHFEFDSYNISAVDEGTLQHIGDWLRSNDTVHVMIEGHCDERGTNEYNMALGEQRALAARRYLVGLGVGAARLSTVSYGEEGPMDPRSTEDAWSKNRRAHFVVSQ